MADVGIVIGSIVGGSAGGAALGAWQAARHRTITRRGRARLVHEDLYRLQSTVTRMYHQTSAEKEWGKKAWLLDALANKEDQQDVLAHLKGWQFGVCAGALGWAEYLRGGYGKNEAPSDDELKQIYERLAWGRLALSKLKLARFKYTAHDPKLVLGSDIRRKGEDPLRKIEKREADQGAKEYRSKDDTALRSAE